jgi:hypothetical protein
MLGVSLQKVFRNLTPSEIIRAKTPEMLRPADISLVVNERNDKNYLLRSQ